MKLVRGGESRFLAGLPWSLLSFFCGWWGFPFGLIYTCEALYRNSVGGVDITDAWLAAVDAAEKPQPQPAATPPPPQPSGHGKSLLLVAAIVAVIIMSVVGFAYYQKFHVPVVLVNGLEKSYTISVNGKNYEVRAHESVRLELSEGCYQIHSSLPALADCSLDLRQDWWNLRHRVAFVNPDKLALVFWELATYGKNGGGNFQLYPNQDVIIKNKPDYLFEEFPQRLSLKSSDSHVRTRMSVGFPKNCEVAQEMIKKFCNTTAAENYITQYRKLHEGENTAAN